MQDNKCGKETCACSDEKKSAKESTKEASQEEIKKDPTRFGDWEVNGRAIDF